MLSSYPDVLWHRVPCSLQSRSCLHGGMYLHLPSMHFLFLPPHSPSSKQFLGKQTLILDSHLCELGQCLSLLQALGLHFAVLLHLLHLLA